MARVNGAVGNLLLGNGVKKLACSFNKNLLAAPSFMRKQLVDSSQLSVDNSQLTTNFD